MPTPKEKQKDEILINKAIHTLREGGVDCEVVDEYEKGSDEEWLSNKLMRARATSSRG